MDVKLINRGKEGELLLSGDLDTRTARDADALFAQLAARFTNITLNMQELEHISSAGLRVLLGAAQVMEGKGEMVVRNVTEAVREVFDLTGFNNVFTIE